MTYITLHTARLDNGGTRRDAGETVGVGAAKDCISVAEAKTLLDRLLAVAAKAEA